MTALQLIQGLNNALFVLIFGLVAVVAYRRRTRVTLDTVAALFLIGYFVAVALYTALAFVRLSARSSGVTRRRTQAVAAGMGLFGLAILVAGGSIVAPAASGFVSGATQLLALAAAVS